MGVSLSPTLSLLRPPFCSVSHQWPPGNVVRFLLPWLLLLRGLEPPSSVRLAGQGGGLCPVPLPLLLSGNGLEVRALLRDLGPGKAVSPCSWASSFPPLLPASVYPFIQEHIRWVLLCTGQRSWAHTEPARCGPVLSLAVLSPSGSPPSPSLIRAPHFTNTPCFAVISWGVWGQPP